MTGYRADVSSLVHRVILEGSILEMDLARCVLQMSAILEGFGVLDGASDNKAFLLCFESHASMLERDLARYVPQEGFGALSPKSLGVGVCVCV